MMMMMMMMQTTRYSEISQLAYPSCTTVTYVINAFIVKDSHSTVLHSSN